MFSSLIVTFSFILSLFVTCHAVPADSLVAGASDTTGFASYYYQNGAYGACGDIHQDGDFVVALDAAIYDKSKCGQRIQVTNTANGKTVTVVVADRCGDCGDPNFLNLSVAAFEQIANLGAGKVPISWKFT